MYFCSATYTLEVLAPTQDASGFHKSTNRFYFVCR